MHALLFSPQWAALTAILVVVCPLVSLVFVAVAKVFDQSVRETTIARLTLAALTGSLLSSVALLVAWLMTPGPVLDVRLGEWFHAGHYSFVLSFYVDRLSVTMLLLSAVVTVLVARFSVNYLHREPGFARYFLLISAFAVGMNTLVLAGSFDVLFAGWELVGVASFLLVGYFHHRSGPALGTLRTALTYRLADVGLLVAGILLHHEAASSAFADVFGNPRQGVALPPSTATALALLLLLSAAGKSALFPLGGWMVRAMEGPTPSSALFYGALSVHAGTYLLLRAAPILQASDFASAMLVVLGLATALYGTMVSRAQTDVKSFMAYATATQVGLIVAEIGLHWWTWAAIHSVGHVSLRLYQMLRVPSALHDALELRAALQGRPHKRPSIVYHVVPARIRDWIQRAALQRFFVDESIDRFVLQPVMRLSSWCDRQEHTWVQTVAGQLDEDELQQLNRHGALMANRVDDQPVASKGN